MQKQHSRKTKASPFCAAPACSRSSSKIQNRTQRLHSPDFPISHRKDSLRDDAGQAVVQTRIQNHNLRRTKRFSKETKANRGWRFNVHNRYNCSYQRHKCDGLVGNQSQTSTPRISENPLIRRKKKSAQSDVCHSSVTALFAPLQLHDTPRMRQWAIKLAARPMASSKTYGHATPHITSLIRSGRSRFHP